MQQTLEQAEAPNRMRNEPSLEDRAYRIRRNALRMGEVQGQGYIAQALGIADVLAVSYFHAMRYRPDDPEWEGRDRFLRRVGRRRFTSGLSQNGAGASRLTPLPPSSLRLRCRQGLLLLPVGR